MKLNKRHQLFVAAYLKDKNGRQAAVAAGYAPKNAAITASKLLTNPNIQKEVEAALTRVTDKAEVTAARVLQEISRLAFVDMNQMYDEKGQLLPLHKMPEDVRRALAGVESEEVRIGGKVRARVKKVRMTSKERALEMLAKHFKLLTEVVESKNQTAVTIVNPEEVRRLVDEVEGEC